MVIRTRPAFAGTALLLALIILPVTDPALAGPCNSPTLEEMKASVVADLQLFGNTVFGTIAVDGNCGINPYGNPFCNSWGNWGGRTGLRGPPHLSTLGRRSTTRLRAEVRLPLCYDRLHLIWHHRAGMVQIRLDIDGHLDLFQDNNVAFRIMGRSHVPDLRERFINGLRSSLPAQLGDLIAS